MFTHTHLNQLKIITTPIFKELPDNFNFELNEIQTVKLNLSCQAVGFFFYFTMVNILL